ncbi:MAG: tetratricopeptide repeat protein [Kiritimatiellaeota bacterium]|nr:tetratricopeptide repeat protein [Kiritimatiellota bacterium]
MSRQEYNAFREMLRRKAYAEAAAFAEQQTVESPGPNAFWQTQLSLALAGANRTGEAVRAADTALEIEPDNTFALRARAQALYANHDYEAALQDFRELERHSRFREYAGRGVLRCLNRLGHWQELLDCLERRDLSPRESAAWRAYALAGLEQTEAAVEACRRWLAFDPDQPRALWLLADLEIAQEGLPSVLKRMGRLARIPSRPTVYREIYASLCRRAGRDERAIEVYENTVADETDAPRLRRRQAFALAKNGRELEAVPIMEELLRQNPKDHYVHSAYTAACRRAGRLERALEFYQRLLAERPEQKNLYGWIRRVERTLETTHAADADPDSTR